MSKTTSEYTGGMKCLPNTLPVVFEHASIPLVRDQWYTQRIKKRLGWAGKMYLEVLEQEQRALR